MADAHEDAGGEGQLVSTTIKALSVYLCAAIGGFIASIADMVQKEEASAVTKLTALTARFLHVTMEPFWIFLSLVVLATLLCFVFQPSDRKQSFMAGMGIIALIMTITPYKQPLTGAATMTIPAAPSAMRHSIVPLSLVAGNDTLLPTVPGLPPTVTFGVSNRLPVGALVGIRIFDPDSSLELYQKVMLESFRGTQLHFELGTMAVTPRLYYAVELNGFRLPPQSIDLNNLSSLIQIDVMPDQIHTTGVGQPSFTTEIPRSATGGEKSYGGNIFNKLNGSIRW